MDRSGESSEVSHETERAIAMGLTPGKLEHLIREHASVDQIAIAYRTDVSVVQMLMVRRGLSHLSGREKANVTLVREVEL